jgi:hypothetical protein
MGMSRPSYGRPQSSFFGSGSMMQRPMPGGPGKGRPRGRFMRGGPGKGRGQGMPQSMLGMQQPMPARPSFGQLMTQGPMNMPRPTPRPVPFMGQTGQMGQFGNNPPSRPTGSGEGGYGGGNIEGGYQQIPITRPGGFGFSGPAVPDFGQRRTQGPMNMPSMEFPQPTARPVNQTMGRPMPQQSFMGRVANNMPEAPFNAYNRPMGRVGNNMPRLQRPLPSNMEYGMGFYGGGITDLY